MNTRQLNEAPMKACAVGLARHESTTDSEPFFHGSISDTR